MKSESRNPKAERKLKLEVRNATVAASTSGVAWFRISHYGFRISEQDTHSFPARCIVVVAAILVCCQAGATGSWTSVVPGALNPVVELMLLLPDGTVMANGANTSSNWYRLTPDGHGSYINGTWSSLHAMKYARNFFSSAVLQDGRVFVAGGEYPSYPAPNGSTAEIYDPIKDSWREIPVPPSLICNTCNFPGIADAASKVLPDGTVMISPVVPTVRGGTLIFDPKSNGLSQGPILTNFVQNTDEQSWVKLPDDSILTFDNAFHSQRYIPSLGQWIPDSDLPVQLYNGATEIGAGLLLPDGRAFFLGSTRTNVFYSPSGDNSQGSWTRAADIPAPFCAWDNPAAVTVDGKVLCFFGCGQPTNGLYEFDPAANKFTPIGNFDTASGTHAMLALPDGNILMSDGTTPIVRVYVPGGPPITAGKPTISSITANIAGVSYHLAGTKLNGLSAGAAFGDDYQMDSNYPLVRLTDTGGNVYYARTYNWSSTGVATGSKPVTTEFIVPGTVPPGAYSLVVVANGIASDPVSFTYTGPVWVDFNYTNPFGIYSGTYSDPYNTLAGGVNAVGSGGTIAINASIQPSDSTETMTISKPMTITSVDGPSTIGH